MRASFRFLLFMATWLLFHQPVSVAGSFNNSAPVIIVGDGLCPAITETPVCDPDRLLREDDIESIEELVYQAYRSSWYACHDTNIHVELGVYIRVYPRPHSKEDVDEMRWEWGIGDEPTTACGDNGLLLYIAVSEDRRQAHVYLSAGDAMLPTLNRMALQSVEDGMKPFLRHGLYGQAIQAGIIDLAAFVRGDKHLANLQEECLRDFYLSSWFFICVLYCCGGRILLLLMHAFGRRVRRNHSAQRQDYLRVEVEEKLVEIEEHYQHKYPHHFGEYMFPSCPICLEVFPSTKPTEETPLVFQKSQMGSDGNALKSLPCGHVYDHACIVDWMVHRKTKNKDARLYCPICLTKF